MTLRLFVPCDAAALSVGADEVAEALQATAAERGLAIEIVRNGSRGMCWLEPLVEFATPDGRVAFGPVTPADVPSLLDAIVCNGPHALRLGPTEEIPWLKR
ncbi:MAG: formate dehydrogenase, partial [Bradyrhizobium sp.]